MLFKGICDWQITSGQNASCSLARNHGARLGPGLGGCEHSGRQGHSTGRCESRSSTAAPAAAREAAPTAGATQRALPYPRVQAAATRQSAAAGLNAASAVASGDVGAADDLAELVNLSGLWAKDRDRSDAKGYDAMLDVLGLSGMQKVTARLIEGIEVKQSANQFTVNFVTVVPFFKVTEVVPLDAGSAQQSRRDLRHGKQTAAAKTTDGGVRVEMSWGQPMAGSLTEMYSLLPDGCLCVHGEARVGQNHASADTIYTLSKGSRDALLSDSKRRNGSQ